MGDYITPQDYGAVGDGTTDDTAAIQNAVNAASASKTPLLVTPGVYALGPPQASAGGWPNVEPSWRFLGTHQLALFVCVTISSDLHILGGGGQFTFLPPPTAPAIGSFSLFGTAQRYTTVGAITNVRLEGVEFDLTNTSAFGLYTFVAAGIRDLQVSGATVAWDTATVATVAGATIVDPVTLQLSSLPSPSWRDQWIEGDGIPLGTQIRTVQVSPKKLILRKPLLRNFGTIDFEIVPRGLGFGFRLENCQGVRFTETNFRNVRQGFNLAFVDDLQMSDLSFSRFSEGIDMDLVCTHFAFNNLSFAGGGGAEGQCIDVAGQDGVISNVTFQDTGSVAFIYNKGGFPSYSYYAGPSGVQLEFKGVFTTGTNAITDITDAAGNSVDLTQLVAPRFLVSANGALLPNKPRIVDVQANQLTLDASAGTFVGNPQPFWVTTEPVMVQLTGDLTAGSSIITNVSPAPSTTLPHALAIGNDVTGGGIPDGSKIASISGTSVMLDRSHVTKTGAGLPFFAGILGSRTERVSLRAVHGSNGGFIRDPDNPASLDSGNPAIRVAHKRSSDVYIGMPAERDIVIDDFMNDGGSNFIVWNGKDCHFSRIVMRNTSTGSNVDLTGGAAISLQRSTQAIHRELCDLSGSLTDVVVSESQGMGVSIFAPGDFSVDRVKVDGFNLQNNSATDAGIRLSQLAYTPGVKHIGKLTARNGVGSPTDIEVLALSLEDSAKQTIIDGPLDAANIVPPKNTAAKNFIGNADLSIWQRGVSFDLATTRKVADLWQAIRTSGGLSAIVSRETGFNTAQYCMRLRRTAAISGTPAIRFGQQIDSEFAVALAGKTISISAWMRKGADFSAGGVGCNLFYSTEWNAPFNISTGLFAGQTTASAVSPVNGGGTLSTDPSRVFFGTLTVPADAKSLFLRYTFTPSGAVGSADYLDVTCFEIVIGPEPNMPYQPEDPIEGLERCFNRFQKSFELNTAPAQNTGLGTGEFRVAAAGVTAETLGTVELSLSMRVAPVVTLYNPANTNTQVRNITAGADCSGSSAGNITTKSFELACTNAAGGAAGDLLGVHWTADAEY